MLIFLHTIEQWFWHTWDHLWRVVGWNIVMFLVAMPLFHLTPWPLPVAWFIFVFGPLFTGTICWAWVMADERTPGLADLWKRIGRVWFRATGLHLLFAVVMGLVGLNLWFYMSESAQARFGPIIGLFLGGLSLWIGAYIAIMWMWAQVALSEDREQGRRSLIGAIKQAGRITLYHPLLSLAHLAVVGGFGYLMMSSLVGMVIFLHATVAVYLASAVHEMYWTSEQKAQIAKEREQPAEKKPTSWKEIMADDKPATTSIYARRPRRTLKDLLKPWEM